MSYMFSHAFHLNIAMANIKIVTMEIVAIINLSNVEYPLHRPKGKPISINASIHGIVSNPNGYQNNHPLSIEATPPKHIMAIPKLVTRKLFVSSFMFISLHQMFFHFFDIHS